MGNVESVDGSTELKPHILPLKLPMPEQYELEERFALVLNSMNLPPDKARLLRQYDNEKKWDLICDQERFQVKNPPHAYIQKLQGFLDPGVTRKKFRRRVQESTKVLRELEISLRTNHIGWVREFLNDDNKGLDVLVEGGRRFDFEGLDPGEDAGALDKSRSWSRSIEDLHQSNGQPVSSSLARSARHSVLRYSTMSGRKTLKNSRLVSQKDDVHVCIMCLRAIMNYQYGFNLVMSHPHAVNEIALSLNNKNARTKALVLELLAAVCLVRGGHEIILSAFDNFKEVCKEKQRFEKLMDYFQNEDSNIDFMVACMQFINIVVHSVEDMNFRVHLQYEFTKLGLDNFLEKSKHTESDKLAVQIQAYLDNVFDVGGLLEDAETKNVALEKVEELEDHLSHLTEKLLDLENENMMRVAELEKQLLHKNKELEVVRETYEMTSTQVQTLRRVIKEKDAAFQRHTNLEKKLQELEQQGSIRVRKQADGDIDILPIGGGEGLELVGVVPAELRNGGNWLGRKGGLVLCWLDMQLSYTDKNTSTTKTTLLAIRIKKPIKTKFRLPVFNWTALKPNQINGTVFNEIDDERILEELDLDRFEELFKTKAQGPVVDLSCTKGKVTQKPINKVTLLEANRSKNLAITLRKAGKNTEEICKAIHTFDLKALPIDFIECLMRFLPTEAEVKLLRQYERDRKPLEDLAEEDRFMLHFSKIERLTQRMSIITFVGNFEDNLNMLTPQLNAIIAASASVKSSQKMKRMLEIILALGNYMNSSKRGSVYGFKLQSLDLLLDTKSTDRKLTLLHYIAIIVKEKYQEIATFWHELHFVDKAAAVSLENVLLDVKELGRGMELIRRECSLHDHSVLKNFVTNNESRLAKLQRDAKTAEEAFNAVVTFFGENPKTTPPSVFFPVFVRFIKAYKDAEEENEQRKKQEAAMREKMLAQEAKQNDAKVQRNNKRQQQHDLIAELRRRQAKEHRPVYEGKDGTIEDIITVEGPVHPVTSGAVCEEDEGQGPHQEVTALVLSPSPLPAVLKSVPFTARTAKRGSRFFCDSALCDESNC
ncbi:FMNL3 protein, partial [Polypterus senegalus]|nr:FMNL3 protein [Polypterus senegalus]